MNDDICPVNIINEQDSLGCQNIISDTVSDIERTLGGCIRKALAHLSYLNGEHLPKEEDVISLELSIISKLSSTQDIQQIFKASKERFLADEERFDFKINVQLSQKQYKDIDAALHGHSISY